MKEPLNYTYYVIQVGDKFIANQYCDTALTDDEDQALVFTDFQEATLYASAHHGVVAKRCVDDCELQMLTEQHYMKYMKLSEEEREKMAIFCRELVES